MNAPALELEDLLAAHLAGEGVEVPAELRSEFDRALAGHQALAGLFQETVLTDEHAAADREPPALSTDYQIEREIGRGGMGVVYLVHQKSLGRRVALKVLRPGERTFGPLVRRFLDEARHLARLRHPNIVSIHEIGDAAGEPYFTMDYVDGEPLSTVLRRGPLPPTQAIEVLKQIAAAVQHAHRQGIIHRDLKPSNVLLDGTGHVFVTDFGLARDLTQSAKLTMSGELLGTPQYMAPEQARGDAALIGEATDIHALGMILYEMLTGQTPYGSTSAADTLVRLLHEEPKPLRALDDRIPRDLETICLKMLGKHPSARYANVSALLEDLRRYEAGEPLLARRPSRVLRAVRWCRRHWKSAALIAATAAVVLMLASRMFDKSYAELVAWGDEEVASGRPEIAAQVYLRAWNRASEPQRHELTDRVVRLCRSLDDPKAAVDLALKIVELAPDADFGRHDYLVAQALVTRVRSQSPEGHLNVFQTTPQPELRIVQKRLERALAGNLSAEQRAEADQTLAAVNLALSQDKPWSRLTPEFLHKLPTGSAAELRLLIDDATQPLWNRGKAAFALGKQHEEARDREAALAAYRQAYELIRSVYPMYGGVKVVTGPKPSRADAPDAEECRLVRDLVAALRRLSPEALPEPRGGLQFSVEGFSLPTTIGVELTIQLCDPAIDDPHQGLPYNLPRLAPLRQDRPVTVEVLDGVYRLDLRGHHSRWDQSAERTARLLQVDVDGWPKQVEIRGGLVQLPPVRLRLAQEIQLTKPESGASVDLRNAELRWTPIPNADHYMVHLLYTAETPTPTTFFFLSMKVSEPQLGFTKLLDHERRQLRKNYLPGRTGGWRVDAYDADGRRIGLSLDEQRFLVVHGLDDGP
jgi:predicted Ser/Thr protein kinase